MRFDVTCEEISSICKDSFSYAEVLRKLGHKASGNAYTNLKNAIKKYNIDISHFTGQRWQKSPHTQKQTKEEKYSSDEILCKNSKVTQKVLREYIRRHAILPWECSICKNNGYWLNKKLTLELDHIDGDPSNNDLINLRYLCPNCHSQTNTFRGKNKKKIIED